MSQQRFLIFKVFTVAMALAVIAASSFFLKNKPALLEQYPKLASIFSVYLANGLLLLTGLVALFFQQKWGFWLLVCASMLAFCLEIYADFFFLKTARIPFSLALMAWLVRPIFFQKTEDQ